MTSPGLVDASTARVAEALRKVAARDRRILGRDVGQPATRAYVLSLLELAASELEASGTEKGE